MQKAKIALIGAGSRSFGPATVRDILLSEILAQMDVHIVLMDIVSDHLHEITSYTRSVAKRLGREVTITATTDLARALDGACAVVSAIEVDRFLYWTQDYHIARKHGFKQVFGENGGPGGLFHALRNMGPTVTIAHEMERLCPEAPLLNFTNPEHKLCEAVTRLTSVKAVGLCHGFYMGMEQIAHILGRPVDELEMSACGINHFTWFQTVRDKATGEDLYPALRQAEREGDWLTDWHEIGLARILFRVYGLWPSPAANHFGEYLRWAGDFVASELQYFYDPADGHPWETGVIPDFIYSLSGDKTTRPWRRTVEKPEPMTDMPLYPSGELPVPIIEGILSGKRRELGAINVRNDGAIPNLPDDMIVEVPGFADSVGIHSVSVDPLPEGIVAHLRVQGSINKLLVEAFAERSRNKLLQALLLDPTVDSYRNAVTLIDEMITLQKGILPELS